MGGFRQEVIQLAIRCLNEEVTDTQLEYLLVTQKISRDELADAMEYIVRHARKWAIRHVIFWAVLGWCLGSILPKLVMWFFS